MSFATSILSAIYRFGKQMSHRPISGQFNQVATRFRVKEATANHAMTRVAAELIRKRRIRVLKVGVYT
jgi:hypothetical protein